MVPRCCRIGIDGRRAGDGRAAAVAVQRLPHCRRFADVDVWRISFATGDSLAFATLLFQIVLKESSAAS